ncbi:MAG: hypothetical protein KGD58_01580 [Candidatus Lokiarchaeota archaeon]|nr:hypothetical protein [Candidatus Lokiarchaeota archaeon]
MTEISTNKPIQDLTHSNQVDLLFEIYRLRKVRKQLNSKLTYVEKLLKSGRTLNIGYKFEALKVFITENSTQLKNLLAKVDDNSNLFDLTKNLNECELYIQNLIKQRKKEHIDQETFELTKGHYLKKILSIQDSIRQLKVSASTYSLELREELIMLEDQRIRLTTEKMRRNITKEEFKKNNQEIENLKQKLEDKLAFLQVKILDYEFD